MQTCSGRRLPSINSSVIGTLLQLLLLGTYSEVLLDSIRILVIGTLPRSVYYAERFLQSVLLQPADWNLANLKSSKYDQHVS